MRPLTKRLLFIVDSIVLLLACGAAGYLTYIFFSVRSGNAAFNSACALNEVFNCNKVASTVYAEFFGIPISMIIGAILAAFLAIRVRLFLYEQPVLQSYFHVALLVTWFAGGVYFIIMKWVIQSYCTFCIGIDVALLWVLSTQWWISYQQGMSFFPVAVRFTGMENLWIMIKTGLIPALVVGALFWSLKNVHYDPSVQAYIEPASIVKYLLAQKRHPVPSYPMAPQLGDPKAPITIVEFSDFQCPWCRVAASKLASVMYRFPGKIRVIFKNFPMSSKCNPALNQEAHPSACAAAQFALCAHNMGLFDTAYEALFDLQDVFRSDRFLEVLFPYLSRYKKLAHIDYQAFDQCMKSVEIQKKIEQDVNDGLDVKLQATPTLFINGIYTEGALSYEVMVLLIQELLKS